MDMEIMQSTKGINNGQKPNNPSFSSSIIKTSSFDDAASNISEQVINGLEHKAKSLCGEFDTFTLYKEDDSAINRVINKIKYTPQGQTKGMQERTGYVFINGLESIERFLTKIHKEFMNNNPID